MKARRVRVDILGPIELSVDGELVRVSRLKVRQLLAALAITTPDPLSTDRATDLLWPTDPPNDPRAAFRVVVSRLRSTLGAAADALEATDTGLVLHVESDRTEFKRLVTGAESSDGPERVAALRDALALWRAAPLDELADSATIQAAITELGDAHATAQLALAHAVLDNGDPNEAALLAQPRATESPIDERWAICLATARARQGRKADALHVLDTTRRHLRDELGVLPGSELQRVEADILAGTVELESAPQHVQADTLPFVGRSAEMEALVAAGPGITTVVGEPGAGKSALLHRATADLAESGFDVVTGAATASPERPMEVLVQLGKQIVQSQAGACADEHAAAALARLGVVEPTGHRDLVLTRDGLVAAMVDFLVEWAPAGSVVIAIDDCQWLDRGTTAVITRVAASGQCRILAASRPNVPAHITPLLPMLDGSQEFGVDGFAVDGFAVDGFAVGGFALGGLSAADVHAVIEDQIPALRSDALAQSLLERSGGNPLFLGLLVELLAEGTATDGELPTNVLVAVQDRMTTMSAGARDTLQIASVFLDWFPLDALRALSATADSGIEEAVGARLIEVDPDAERARFAHQLVAEAAYQMLAEGRRVALHDEIGRLLEDAGASPTEYALHAGEATALDPMRAITAHRDAADVFGKVFAWDTALLHARLAKQHLDALGREASTFDAQLLVTEGTSLRLLGDLDHEVPLLAGAELASSLGLVELLARALIELCGQSRTNPADDVGRRISSLLDIALESELPRDLEAELSAVASTSLSLSSQHERAEALYRRGHELAVAGGDPTVEAKVLARMNGSLPNPTDFPLRKAAVERLRALTADDAALRFDAVQMALGVHMVEGDRAATDQAIEELRTLGATHVGRNPAAALCRAEASYARFIGDLDRAETFANQLLELEHRTVSEEWTLALYTGLIASIREAQHRLGELLPLADDMIRRHPDFLPWQMMALACAGAADEQARVKRDLARLRTENFGGWIHNTAWWAALSVVAAPIALVDDVDAARSAYQLLLPQSGLYLWNGSAIHQPADSALALFASTFGDDAAAATHRARAEDLKAQTRATAPAT